MFTHFSIFEVQLAYDISRMFQNYLLHKLLKIKNFEYRMLKFKNRIDHFIDGLKFLLTLDVSDGFISSHSYV